MSIDSLQAPIAKARPLNRSDLGSRPSRFKPLTVRELLAVPPPTWTVHGIIPDHGIGMIWGASGSGKTFAALDLACAVARGTDWNGRGVAQGGVLYIATEGRLAKRLESYMQFHGMSSESLSDLRIIEAQINLMAGDASVLIDQARSCEVPNFRMVVIDTLNRAMPGGNENASEDMGRMVEAASQIAEALGCVVIYIHHAGKDDSKGSRGHSSLKAATEFELSIRRDGSLRKIQVEKVRDGEDGYILTGFTLTPVGDSVVVSSSAVATGRARTGKLTRAERGVLDALVDVLGDPTKCQVAPASLLVHGPYQGQTIALLNDWRESAYARQDRDASLDTKRKCFQRARNRLLECRQVQEHDGYVWLL